jgi:AbrB family looped-hinge helix DNA binding protein
MFYFLLVPVRGLWMRVTSKGQVTIPKHIRKRGGIGTGSEVDFVLHNAEIVLRKAKRRGSGRAAEPQAEFAEYLDRVTGIVDLGMSTDAFMDLLRGE